jgi:hypothetical protein
LTTKKRPTVHHAGGLLSLKNVPSGVKPPTRIPDAPHQRRGRQPENQAGGEKRRLKHRVRPEIRAFIESFVIAIYNHS